MRIGGISVADREKVIRGLERFIDDFKPFCGNRDDWQRVYDALALLREQEPRVMTLEELQAIETPWNRNTPPYLFVERRSFAESRWMSWGFLHDGVRLHGTMGVQNYGSKWRVWNLQPTPEQMRETPWEGEEDHEA